MRCYRYICDKCGKDTTHPIRIISRLVNTLTDKERPEDEPDRSELCEKCFGEMLAWIYGKDGGDTEPAEQAEAQLSEPEQRGIAQKSRSEIIRLYKEGKEMGEIEKQTGVPIAIVSRVIAQEGLGDERYKGQYIPDKGSASIQSTMGPRISQRGRKDG